MPMDYAPKPGPSLMTCQCDASCEWAYDKIYRLVQYFGIFAGGMSNRWKGLNYVEICSGPGRCITRNDRDEMDGTALAIICHKHFSKLKKGIFIDASPRVVAILNQRIKALGKSDIAEAVVGDYSDAAGLSSILGQLPQNCLNLVLLIRRSATSRSPLSRAL
jgi:hypothetical protein